jgi:hypothetical protein
VAIGTCLCIHVCDKHMLVARVLFVLDCAMQVGVWLLQVCYHVNLIIDGSPTAYLLCGRSSTFVILPAACACVSCIETCPWVCSTCLVVEHMSCKSHVHIYHHCHDDP